MPVNVPRFFVTFVVLLVGLVQFGCRSAPKKKDPATMNLTAQEERGRRLYEMHCEGCHDPPNANQRNGPSMVGLYERPMMPSGIPARDDKITEVIMDGRRMMPGFGNRLSEQQVTDMIAYMKKY